MTAPDYAPFQIGEIQVSGSQATAPGISMPQRMTFMDR
jgi:hypothetical protein